jgi:Flp pilus assembly protein TadD/Zn-dependent protease with chaperone function
MKLLARLLAAGFMACIVFAAAVLAQYTPREVAREQTILEALAKRAPTMVDKFKAATASADQGDYEPAITLYQEVLVKAPDFEPALRRLGMCLADANRRDEGLKMTRRAIELHRTPENLLAHVQVLTMVEGGATRLSSSDIVTAFGLAKEAKQRNTDPTDPTYDLAIARLALVADDLAEFEATVCVLNTKFPKEPETHYYHAISLGGRGDEAGAKRELDQAEALGMPREDVQAIRNALERSKIAAEIPVDTQSFGLGEFAFLGKYLWYGTIVVGIWIAGLLALFAVGKVLSAKTMSLIRTSDPNDMTDGRHAGLRRAYRAVISIAGVYYFISQPVVALLVIVFTFGVVLFFLYIGWLPIKLMILVAFIGLASIFYMIKTLFARPKQEDPGRALTEAEAPGLWSTVREVAATIKTRPVTEIRLTIGTDVAVYERGGIRRRLNDKGERVLILGVAGLNDFPQSAFRAVLAHEYGHFAHRDTAGGDVALRVNEHIFRLAAAMAASGTATVYNLAFQFLRLYHFHFRRITHGATRLQEVMADRVAVYHYGAEAFRKGLTHVIRRELEFTRLADGEIAASRTDQRAIQNLYELKAEEDSVIKELEAQVAAAIAHPTTEDDTHPSPQERFELIAKIRSLPNFPVKGVVWDLFTDREALTAEMNKLIAGLVGARVA